LLFSEFIFVERVYLVNLMNFLFFRLGDDQEMGDVGLEEVNGLLDLIVAPYNDLARRMSCDQVRQ
jgi:hypothetical protein